MTDIKKPLLAAGKSGGVFASIPGLTPLTIDGVTTTDFRGIVPQALLLAPLKVTIRMWGTTLAPGSVPDKVQLYWISNKLVKLLDTLDVPPAPPPLRDSYDLYISVGDLFSAPYREAQLYYTVTTDGGLNMNTMEGTVTITIDRDVPRWLLPSDTLRFVVPPVPALNEQYLLANPSVRFFHPFYNVGAVGDYVELYVSNQPNPPPGLPAAGRSLVDFSTNPPTVALDAAAFRSLNNGPAYVFSKIFDATGNFSTRSVGAPFVVGFATTPLPVPTLPAPVVQHTLSKTGYLYCNSQPSVMSGIRWLIPANSNILVNDRLVIVCQGFNENNWATQNPNFIISQTITWAPEHASSKGAFITVGTLESFDTTLFPLRDAKSATLVYEVWRNGVKEAESHPGRVRVDLTYSTGCYCTPRGVVCVK